MQNSKALTKIQSAIMIVVIVVAGIVGGVYFFLRPGSEPTSEVIRIGVCGDLDNYQGKGAWQAAILAAEQINADGGVLGRNFEIIAEDDDSETPPFDVVTATNALTKLITVDKVDFILSSGGVPIAFQDICADHNIIFFSQSMIDELAQRVADDYGRFKGFFRAGAGNVSSAVNGMADCLLTLREYTGFTKVATITLDHPVTKGIVSGMVASLNEQDFDIVYQGVFPAGTFDFSSYFAAVETAGAEVLVPMIPGPPSTPFVKEYYDRQSPVVVWGNVGLAQESDFWELSDGKCEFISFVGYPVISGYPLTSKTLPTREAYIERWGEIPIINAVSAYDLVRFILPDAIERAGTIESEALIEALEETDIETSLARRFVFTSAHDIMVGAAGPNRPGEDYLLVCLFQWQDGKQVPVYPKEIMEEAEATYKFPPWSGPWD